MIFTFFYMSDFNDFQCTVFGAMMNDFSKESIILIMSSANKQMCFVWVLLKKRNTAWKTSEKAVITKNKKFGHWKKALHRIKFRCKRQKILFSLQNMIFSVSPIFLSLTPNILTVLSPFLIIIWSILARGRVLHFLLPQCC